MLSTNSMAIIGKWLMDFSVFVYKLCPGTEEKDVFISIFFLHCYLLFTVCNYKLQFHLKLSVMEQKKSFYVLFLKPVRWHKETIWRSVLCDYQTHYRDWSLCREQLLFDFKDPDNSVCLIICLWVWLTDKSWLTLQSCCDLVSSRKRTGQAFLLHQM